MNIYILLTLLNVAILKTYSELGNNFTNIRKIMVGIKCSARGVALGGLEEGGAEEVGWVGDRL